MTTITIITSENEMAYLDEIRLPTEWCQENNFSLNVSKIKELVIDFRKQNTTHTPIGTGGNAVILLPSGRWHRTLSTQTTRCNQATRQMLITNQMHCICVFPYSTYCLSCSGAACLFLYAASISPCSSCIICYLIVLLLAAILIATYFVLYSLSGIYVAPQIAGRLQEFKHVNNAIKYLEP